MGSLSEVHQCLKWRIIAPGNTGVCMVANWLADREHSCCKQNDFFFLQLGKIVPLIPV